MIQPINETVLIRVLKEDEGKGGILLPEIHKEKESGAGEVISISISDDLPIHVGDKVFFDTLLLTSVKVDNEELKFIKFSDILAYDRG